MKQITNIINNKKQNKVSVGVIMSNENSKILMIEETLKNVNKVFYNIPTIEVEQLDKNDIIKTFHHMYGIKIPDLDVYLNQYTLLDNCCNEKVQVNFYSNIQGCEVKAESKMIWMDIKNILDNINVLEPLKQSVEIYNYNLERIRRGCK